MSEHPPEDAALCARIAHGRAPQAREALGALYERHAAAVLAFARRSLGEGPLAEDVMQDTFLAAARRADAFRGECARSWLLAIAANRLRDLARRESRRRLRERTAARPELDERPPRARAGLDEALSSLSPKERAVLELRVGQGLEHAAVARALGCSLRSAKTWTQQALQRLRHRLEGER